MTLFVWDLHGTLEKGNEKSVIDISNKVLEQFGYSERFAYADNPRLYGRKWYEYFSWLFEKPDHARDLTLQEACFKLSEASPEMQYRWVKPTPHATEVLETAMSGHQQILISNTRSETLTMFIDVLGYGKFFHPGNAFAVDGHAAKPASSKEDVLKQYLKDSGEHEQIVIVGDSPSDMRLKSVAGGVTYLFAHPDVEFRDCETDHRIRDLRELFAEM